MTTILIVDDEPGVRDLLRDALEVAGFQTELASNGADVDMILGYDAVLGVQGERVFSGIRAA